MSDLSFLPRELRRPRRRAVPRASRLAGVALATAVLAGLAWYYAYAVSTYLSARSELRALQEERERIRGAAELRRMVQEEEARWRRLQELARPYTPAPPLADALRALNRSVPRGMELQRIQVQPSRAITVDGVAPSLSDVARFMVALEGTGFYARLQARFPAPFAAGSATGVREVTAITGYPAAVRFQVYGLLQVPGGS